MNHPTFTCNHINQQQLADYWGISQRTLERWRATGWGLLFLKIGGRAVYRVEDILAYEERHLAESIQSRVCSRQVQTRKALLQNFCSMRLGNAVSNFWRHS